MIAVAIIGIFVAQWWFGWGLFSDEDSGAGIGGFRALRKPYTNGEIDDIESAALQMNQRVQNLPGNTLRIRNLKDNVREYTSIMQQESRGGHQIRLFYVDRDHLPEGAGAMHTAVHEDDAMTVATYWKNEDLDPDERSDGATPVEIFTKFDRFIITFAEFQHMQLAPHTMASDPTEDIMNAEINWQLLQLKNLMTADELSSQVRNDMWHGAR